MKLRDLRRKNIQEIEVSELPDRTIIGKLNLEQVIKAPGDILIINNKSYITVEKIHHYYFDGFRYQFAKTTLMVKGLENFI